MTYSIVARDGETGALGVAVQSHFLAVGRSVPFAAAGIGAVATQANVRTAYGRIGLERMAAGLDAAAALEAGLAEDDQPAVRQVAMIDAEGRTAAHTGSDCWNHAAHHAADGVCAQANMVASDRIPRAMVDAFRSADGELPVRLLAALSAAEALGGDLRGRQSAALLVVGGARHADPSSGVLLDLRVDDDLDPLLRLRRLVEIATAFRPMWEEIRGPACRGPLPPTPEQSARAIAVLEGAQRVYGPDNAEPDFWRAVALFRSGRRPEGAAIIERITLRTPGWRTLYEDVTGRWPIP